MYTVNIFVTHAHAEHLSFFPSILYTVSTCAVPAKDYERMPPSVEFPLNKHCTLSIHGRTR